MLINQFIYTIWKKYLYIKWVSDWADWSNDILDW